MHAHGLEPTMSRREILERVLAVEREARELLEEASEVVPDPEERRLFARLAGREQDAIRELTDAEERLEAEAFVQQALDV